MSGENQPRPKRNELVAAQSAEFHLLQNTQKLYLREQAQIPDFIKKQRAVFRLLKVAFSRSHGPREGALFVAK